MLKKGDLCYVEDYQEFGEVIILLDERLTENIEGEPMTPMWEGYLISSTDERLMEFYFEECHYPVHLILISESKLIKVS